MKTIDENDVCIEHEKECLIEKLIALQKNTFTTYSDVKVLRIVINKLNESILENLYEISKQKLLKPVDTGLVRVLFKKVMKQSIELNEAYEASCSKILSYNKQLKTVELLCKQVNIPFDKFELIEINLPRNEIDNVLSSIAYALDSELNDLTIEMIK